MKRTPIKTVEKLNYSMIFAGKMRTFDKVVLSLSPTDESEMMSMAEYRRLSGILRDEVLVSDKCLLVGEVVVLMSFYKLSREEIEKHTSLTLKEMASFKSKWEQEFPKDLSDELRSYFKGLSQPQP
jgi:hypothetical protein